VAYSVNWGGHTETYRDASGATRVRWVPFRVVKGTAYESPIQGYGVDTCNTPRLWSAEAVESFDFLAFNTCDYYQAVNEKLVSETVTKVLYPNDEPAIGTLDGANVEMREEADADNFFLFGHTADELERVKREGYRPADRLAANDELGAVLELIGSGRFTRGDTDVPRPLVENLTRSDPFLVLADYTAYIACQEEVSQAWTDTEHWTRMSILNTARGGKFSSDRSIREYCDDIWGVEAAPVKLPED
jgi:glucan phosphorylase